MLNIVENNGQIKILNKFKNTHTTNYSLRRKEIMTQPTGTDCLMNLPKFTLPIQDRKNLMFKNLR